MKKVMVLMTVSMGFIMSLVLSLIGTLMGGHFTVPSWLVSFAISFVISLVIGFIVPIKKVSDAVCRKVGVVAESPKGNLVSGVVSDLIYTPIITVTMVSIMITNAAKAMKAAGVTEGIPTIGRALPASLIVSLVVGYVVIIIAQPILLKLFIPKGGKPEGV